MNAPLSAPAAQLAQWFRWPSRVAAPARCDARVRFDAVGDFLFEHELEPTGATFAVVQSYLEGRDAKLRDAIDRLLTRDDRLRAFDLERIAGQSREDRPPAASVEALARELEARVGECIGAISESFASTSDYSAALDLAAEDMATAPDLTYHRLISLTLDVAETTRQISRRMESVQADTQRLQRELKQAQRAAEEDHLTGLYNRRGFLDGLKAAVAAQPARIRTLALCDIDNFKVVNDRHGHDVGDRVLTYVANQLRRHLPSSVMISRYGGEEFACLFDGTDPAEAAAQLDGARKLLSARSLRDQHGGAAIGTVTFSAGVCRVGAETAEAFRRADAALYDAKHAGKDRVLIAR